MAGPPSRVRFASIRNDRSYPNAHPDVREASFLDPQSNKHPLSKPFCQAPSLQPTSIHFAASTLRVRQRAYKRLQVATWIRSIGASLRNEAWSGPLDVVAYYWHKANLCALGPWYGYLMSAGGRNLEASRVVFRRWWLMPHGDGPGKPFSGPAHSGTCTTLVLPRAGYLCSY